MAKYLLLRGWLVFLKTSVHCGMPIFLKVNHQLESRMQENCQSGSEGGAKPTFVPTPISTLVPRSKDRATAGGRVERCFSMTHLKSPLREVRLPKRRVTASAG